MQRVVTFDHIMYTVFPNIVSAEIQRSQYIRPNVTVHKCAENIQGRKLYEEIRYVHYEPSMLSQGKMLWKD